MPKRKLVPVEDDDASSVTSNVSGSEGRPKRRRNQARLSDEIQFIFDAMRNEKKPDESYLCEAFLRLPKKKTEPQYYEVVKNPLDVLKIQQKIKTDIYNNPQEFYDDVELLINNAKMYYAKATEEYDDACKLWQIFTNAKEQSAEARTKYDEELLQSQKRKPGRPTKALMASSAPMILEEDGTEMTMKDAIEELFGAIITAVAPDGGYHAYNFHLLPSSEKYPEYYQVIKRPIDMKSIALKIQKDLYESLESLSIDMNLMFDNACMFNEPGSQIYKDAKTLKKLTEIRKDDLLHILNSKKNVRLRSKQSPEGKKWSELMSRLQEGEVLRMPEDDSDLDLTNVSITSNVNEDLMDDSDDDVDLDSPFWQLFLAAKSFTISSEPDYLLCEPFKRLPNKRWHADYYQEIKHPISMSQIRKKIRRNDYGYLTEMVDDFNLMFSNAKQYNRPDSRLYRDAIKLQKFVHAKAEELPEVDEEADSDLEGEDDAAVERKTSQTSSSKPWTFKRRAKLLFKTLMDFMTDDGRQPIVAFIELPPKNEYPEYYDVITDPVDMEMIEAKIKSDQYFGDEELIGDFKLMFENCKKFNEKNSQIFSDSQILMKVLMDKVRELHISENEPNHSTPRVKSTKNKNKYSHFLSVSKNVKLIYNEVRDYADEQDRVLSEVFTRLPLKALYPDYYEVIKQPIDMELILAKWKNGAYTCIDDVVSDFMIMFHNACIYNEPESQIYHDSLTLQNLVVKKRAELSHKEDEIPNVQAIIHDMLISLFISVFNHQVDGVYCSDVFAELPEHEFVNGQKIRPLSFDILKRRVDKGLYRRLDFFQEDLFALFDRARKHAGGKNTKLFEQSEVLQRFYIETRDNIFRNGSVLKSRALFFTNKSLNELLDSLISKEEANDEAEKKNDEKEELSAGDDKFANDSAYKVGDFVYLTSEDKIANPILHIDRISTTKKKPKMVYGFRYYRPSETFHLPTRKFYEQEVFKTEVQQAVPLNELVGKCVVLSAPDYTKLEVKNFKSEDVYNCETRYNTKHRCFKKIMKIPFTITESVETVERSTPLELKRVDSIFKERLDKHKEELAEIEEETKVVQRQVPNILKLHCEQDGKTSAHYQQYNASFGGVKLGDYVYVKSVGVKAVRHISKIWVTSQGNAYISGTKFVHSYNVSLVSDRKPYRQEVYLTSTKETVPISDVLGHCSVLAIRDYLTCRHTEVDEKDVFLVEKFLDEMNQRLCVLQSALLRFELGSEIYPDEIYFFSKPLNPQKFEVTAPAIVKKPVIHPRIEPVEFENEDSMDGRPGSIASVDSGVNLTPKINGKKGLGARANNTGNRAKVITSYILFASEHRKAIMNRNPSISFGDISRQIGSEWKKLPDIEKRVYEEKAQRINLEAAEKAALERPTPPTTPITNARPTSEFPLPSSPEVVFECLWESCDFMFEDLADLYDHLLTEPNGHLYRVHTVFECSWRGCSRHKKSSLAPFPIVQRLMRHIRDVHLIKNNGTYIPFNERSRNMFASTRKSLLNNRNPFSPMLSQVNSATGASEENNPYALSFGNSLPVNGENQLHHTSPLFVTPPPKTQRLLHSEAYIKYIENLDKPFVCNWEKQILATQENTTVNDTGRLPANWLANDPAEHGSALNALWALREHMMKDSLGISKIL